MVAVIGPRAVAVGKVGAGPSNAQATRLIGDARKELGWREGPNNANPYTKHVMGDAHQPWCAAFVSTMLERQNIPGISRRMFSASAAGLAGQFQSAGRYFPSGGKPPQPGDVVFFGGRGSEHHTGIVQKVENGKIYTIEGNSSDQVSERVYSLNDPGIGGYGRVFGDGDVSGDLGFDTSQAGQGTAGGRPAGRAEGRGSAGRALSTGVDASAYFDASRRLLLRLLLAMLNGDPAAIAQALAEMFPYVSQEDLAALAQTLQANPELAAKLAANPELLQQLAANPSPEAAQQLVAGPQPAVDGNAASLAKELLSSPELKRPGDAQAAMMPLLRQLDEANGNGWRPRQPQAPSGGWRP